MFKWGKKRQQNKYDLIQCGYQIETINVEVKAAVVVFVVIFIGSAAGALLHYTALQCNATTTPTIVSCSIRFFLD